MCMCSFMCMCKKKEHPEGCSELGSEFLDGVVGFGELGSALSTLDTGFIFEGSSRLLGPTSQVVDSVGTFLERGEEDFESLEQLLEHCEHGRSPVSYGPYVAQP